MNKVDNNVPSQSADRKLLSDIQDWIELGIENLGKYSNIHNTEELHDFGLLVMVINFLLSLCTSYWY